MDDLNPRAVVGGNNPPIVDPEILAQAKAKAEEFSKAANVWIALGETTNTEQAGNLVDFIAGARGVWKVVDDCRKDAKKPHDDAAKAVQSAFMPILDAVEAMVAKLKPMQTAWLKKEQDRLAKEQAEREAEARKRAAEVEAERIAAQERGDFLAAAELEKAEKDAAKDVKAAEKAAPKAVAKSATGGAKSSGLRLSGKCSMTNFRAAVMHFADHPGLKVYLEGLANEELRDFGTRRARDEGHTIPGFTIEYEEK